MGSNRTLRPDGRLVQEFVYEQQRLPTDKSVVLYIRQSSDVQVKKNRQSTILQDEELGRRLVKMGWTDDLIIKIDTDQGRSGQVIKGEKFQKRDGLDRLYKL